jgi:hypothetical protein
MKRLALVLAVALTGCAPDGMIGTYAFTITGTDTQTAPQSQSTTASGSGWLTITKGKTDAYIVTVANSDTGSCTLKGTKKKDDSAMTFDLVANQPCVLRSGGNAVNATITSGTVNLSVTQVSQNEVRKDISMAVNYNWTYTAFTINFVGTGTRTYAGTEQ